MVCSALSSTTMYSLDLSLTFLLAFSLSIADTLCAPTQFPIQVPAKDAPRKLHGRFIQITDMHPDPYYKAHKSLDKACHRKKPKKKKDRADFWGTAYSECDSPLRLTNYTLDFLDKHWSSEIDFVVWTGDNARHDNDHKVPRTPAEIFDLNRAVAKKMDKIFTSKGIPVVPSLGNNDLWPHNIMTAGPNAVTNEFSSIWKQFIPFPYHQVFQRGAYYSTEVIPGSVAAISLNTMYFYDSNKAVGGCDSREADDPGNLQFDWLEVQLKTYRSRNMLVWLTGHVPPSPGNYYPECYVRYVELSLRFQDIILGHLYGHMNADHFFFVEAVDLLLDVDQGKKLRMGTSDEEDLCDALLNDFGGLPKAGKADLDQYGVINVSPPVVPNPYLPTFRVYSYNISALRGSGVQTVDRNQETQKKRGRKPSHHRGDHGNKATYCKEEEYRHSWKCILNNTWHSDPDAPSRRNQLWSPLGYAQYYIPDLAGGNKSHKPDFKLEYTTYAATDLHPLLEEDEFNYPVPLGNLPKSLRKGPVEKSKYTPYELGDLTVGSWVGFARRLAEERERKLGKRFRKYMYLGAV